VATYGRIRSTRLLVIGLLVASLMTITMDARGGERGPLATIGRAVGAVVGPLQEGVAAVFRPLGSFFTNVFRAGSLAQRVEVLEEQLAQARAAQSESQSLRAQVEEQERILGIGEEQGFELLGASVIGEAPGNFEWGVVIDQGSNNGVEVDMPVIAAEGLVGRVIEVVPSQAMVRLIIDPDSRVTARLSTSREVGLVIGQQDQPLRFAITSPETEVVPNEIVETSGFRIAAGFEGIFPPGIQIGQVERSVPSEDGTSIDVLVRPNVDFSRLDRVAVVTGVERIAPEFADPPSREELDR
jgi:rod shape-determining protein MreC